MSVSLAEQDLTIGTIALGSRPALVLVDLSNGFATSESPLGGDFADVIAVNLKLVKHFIASNLPIIFTSVVYDNPAEASVFRQRLPDLNILQRGTNWVNIHPKLSDYVNANNLIEKHYPSGFFNTSLADLLRLHSADSLVITGLTTSGCVRATCVDGLQYNYNCVVIEDACGDRNAQAHAMSLHDMHAKYAQVMNSQELISQMNVSTPC